VYRPAILILSVQIGRGEGERESGCILFNLIRAERFNNTGVRDDLRRSREVELFSGKIEDRAALFHFYRDKGEGLHCDTVSPCSFFFGVRPASPFYLISAR